MADGDGDVVKTATETDFVSSVFSVPFSQRSLKLSTGGDFCNFVVASCRH